MQLAAYQSLTSWLFGWCYFYWTCTGKAEYQVGLDTATWLNRPYQIQSFYLCKSSCFMTPKVYCKDESPFASGDAAR